MLEKNFNNHNPMYNLISQENFYNNKISKISLIQNRWKQYLYSHKYLYNKQRCYFILMIKLP